MGPNETLSTVTAFPVGSFANYTWKDTLREHITDLIAGVMLLVLAFMAFVYWWRNGKDYKGRGVIIAEYKPPKDIVVLSAGILQDYRLDNKDITAAMDDMAIKEYIKNVETE